MDLQYYGKDCGLEKAAICREYLCLNKIQQTYLRTVVSTKF